jgi:hypothetical protein
MKQTLTIRTPELAARAQAIIAGLPMEPVHEIIIREAKKDISAEQRGLYFKWMGIIGEELGMTKDAMHEQSKERHLVPIFIRDDIEYAEMVSSLDAVRAMGMKEEADRLWRHIVKETSITKAGIKQMSEFMNEVEREAAGLAIRLPHPDDRGR